MSAISAGFALAAALAISQQLPAGSKIALWRPSELFGPGFHFLIDGSVWPFLMLGSAAVFADALLHGRSVIRLLYGGLALAAIAGGNLLTVSMLWTLMIVVETAIRLTGTVEIGSAMSRSGVQILGVLAAVTAAHLGEDGALLLALAVLLRSLGGMEVRSSSSLAILAPLGALAAISRFPPQPAAIPWIAGAVISAGLLQSLFYRSRFSFFALALTAAGFLAPPAAQTAVWVTVAAVLVARVGLYNAKGLRFAWVTVAAVPFAFFAAPVEPGLLVLATLLTAVLTVISRLQPRSHEESVPGRLEAGVLFSAAVLALLSSGWLPNLYGALTAGLGLAAGYAIGRVRPAIYRAQLPTRLPMAAAGRAGRAVSGALASAVRTTAEVLEGESAALWILLVLLIAIIGLQAV